MKETNFLQERMAKGKNRNEEDTAVKWGNKFPLIHA
jgi:hypothetical protein